MLADFPFAPSPGPALFACAQAHRGGHVARTFAARMNDSNSAISSIESLLASITANWRTVGTLRRAPHWTVNDKW